jgi:hypothetical protein
MNRLVFVRLLYHQGIGQSKLAEPLKATAILSLHDASELFLAVTADKLGANVPRATQFMEYFKLLSPAKLTGGVDLTGRQGMERLNDLRVALKHRGTLPGSAAVDQACHDTSSFLENNTLSVFGMAFTDIDMAEVVPQAKIREKVKAATAAAGNDDLIEAMGLLAEAYDDLFEVTSPRSALAPFRFGKTISTGLREHQIAAILHQPGQQQRGPAGGDSRLAEQITEVTEAVHDMQRALRVIALGVDYWEFERFQRLTPSMAYFLSGTAQRRYPRDYAPTADEFDYCRQFIITVSLRIAEAEAHATT